MIIAFISDIHGNIEALHNCFRFFDKTGVDKVYFLGDAIGYLPGGLEVINFLHANQVPCLKGNHEAMLLGLLNNTPEKEEVYNITYISKNISSSQLEFVWSWAEKIELNFNNKIYLLVHGSPTNFFSGYIYPDTDLAPFENLNYDIIIMGHTHRPFVRKAYNKTFINTGAIGLPRDVGNLSSCCLFNTDTEEASICRIPFNLDSILIYESSLIHNNTIQCLQRKSDSFVGTLKT